MGLPLPTMNFNEALTLLRVDEVKIKSTLFDGVIRNA
jgi:hypothetical protein